MRSAYENEFIGTDIKPGEIRRLIDMELTNDSRLVVVIRYNRADESAMVALVNNLVEIATTRDVLLPRELTLAPFELALLPDFTTLAWKQQLESSPVFGNIEQAKLEQWVDENENFKSIDSFNENSNLLYSRGSYTPEFADHVWLFRGKEMDSLNLLGHSFNRHDSFAKFNQVWRVGDERIHLTDVIVENNFSFDEIDILFSNDAYRFELV